MGALFDRFNVESVKGKEITIGEYFPEVFISDQDQVFCYSGICWLWQCSDLGMPDMKS